MIKGLKHNGVTVMEEPHWINQMRGASIGIVRATDDITGEHKVYMGTVPMQSDVHDQNEEQDVKHLLEWGHKVQEGERGALRTILR